MNDFIKKIRRRVKKKRIGTLNMVLIFVSTYMAYINWQMLETYKSCGSAPESAWCALIAALLGECGICGWIKTVKEKQSNKKTDDSEKENMEDIDI